MSLVIDREQVARAIVESDNFKCEEEYIARGGFEASHSPRLFKVLEDGQIRVNFPTLVDEIDEGTPLCIVTLYNPEKNLTVYCNPILAGPVVNPCLRYFNSPLSKPHPQPGEAGYAAITQFQQWKAAAWAKFRIEELELGKHIASQNFITQFWRGLDRLLGGNALVED
jgi:hypothetical protein